jgi:hypothetical protein
MGLSEATTEIRRHRDLVAFKRPSEPAVCFHARSLQVAEISDKLWNSRPPRAFQSAEIFEMQDSQDQNIADLVKNFEKESQTAELSSRSNNKFNLIYLNKTGSMISPATTAHIETYNFCGDLW